MMNTKPTHGEKNIDVLISDMAHLYNESIILPSVPTDIPAHQQGGGQPSDHLVVTTQPKLDRLNAPPKDVIIKKTRRLGDEQKRKIGRWIQSESWETVFDGGSSSGMVSQFTHLVQQKLDEICPVTEVKITKLSGQLTSSALQHLARARLREYTKNGNSKKFKEIKQKQKDRIKLEGQRFLDKKLERASEGKGLAWLREAKRMSARPGEDL